MIGTPANVTFRAVEGGLVEARCAEFGLAALGTNLYEAEAAILRLIEERTAQLGVVTPADSLGSEHDTRSDIVEEQR